MVEKQLMADLQEKAKSIAEMGAYSMSPAVVFADSIGMSEEVQALRQNKDLQYVVVESQEGKIVASYARNDLSSPTLSARDFMKRWLTDGMVYTVSTPVLHGEEVHAQLHLGFSTTKLADRVAQARVTIALVSLVIFVIGGASVFFIGTALTAPLRNMLTVVDEIARGDLAKRAPVGSVREFSHLGRSFNSMVEHLQHAQTGLEKANISLTSKAEELQLEINERIRVEELVKASLQEKEVLLREVHHRVKNNMQVVSSLLNLQSSYVSNPQDLMLFRESQNRVKSMALIHEKLYKSTSLARIDFGEYVRDLSRTIFRTYNPTGVALEIDIEGVFFGVDTAIPCGLIVNELVSNSLKYAFPEGRRGRVFLRFSSLRPGEVVLLAGDDGIGLPAEIDFQKSSTLGLQLVSMLVQQLGGIVQLRREQGTTFEIVFPSSEHSADGPHAVGSPSS